MIRFATLILALMVIPAFVFSQKTGYQIKVKVEGFKEKEAYLGYYFGDKQYLKDTAYAEPNGWFYFEGNEKLQGGMYLVILPPDNQFFQVLVNDDNQWISMETKLPVAELTKNMKVKDTGDNQIFYNYLNFLEDRRPKAEDLRTQIEAAGDDEKKKQKLQEKITALDQEVQAQQRKIIAEHPKSMTAAVIKANLQLDGMPEFQGEQQEKDIQAFYWMRNHWFDNIDLADPRLLRTPILFPKVDHFINKMTVQHPDSLNIAIDKVLEMVRPAPETFKYYLIHFLNAFAKSNIVGMDAVYVHIAKKYYETGQAPWTDEEQLKKIIENANKLEPILIGRVAPNIEMQTQAGNKTWLHDFNAPLTVLFFWDPDCGHCKKSMPDMVKFAREYKSKGVSVFAICTKLATRDSDGNLSMKEVDECWSTIKEKEMDVFFNAVDPYHRSRYKTLYDIRTTPQVFVLDADKTILSKRIGAEQLPEVIDHILKVKAEKKG